MGVVIRYEIDDPEVDRALVRRTARSILRLIGRTKDELSILFVDGPMMRELNRDYRGIDRTTDVLAFPQEEGPPVPGQSERVLGDIVVSIPKAKLQAGRYRHSLHDEIRRLLVHGAVHLCGYDHKTAAQAKAMRAEERRVLSGRERG